MQTSKKQRPIDRLSNLPESLLIHILSYLGLKEAGKTSVLSKRWEFLWADLPSLQFSETSGKTDKMLKFVYRVTRTLDVRTVNHLEEFEVKLGNCRQIYSFVDGWVKFAVRNKVKKLSILIPRGTFYSVPRVIYSCSSLRSLRVQGIILDMPSIRSAIEWKSLTDLSVEEVQLDQAFVDEVLKNCPVLSILELDGCWGYDHVIVTSPSLHKLTIVHTEDEDEEAECFLEISAPYLHTLGISLNPCGRKLRPRNISSLVRADIDYNTRGCSFGFVKAMSHAKKLIENFQHTQELRVGPECFKAVSKMGMNGWKLSQSSRKHLTVTSFRGNKKCISGIICLLDSSPYLETLVIEGYETKGEYSNLVQGAKGDLDGDLVHLKTIEVRNFADPNCERILTLARILLKRATTLEKMVIVTDVKDSICLGMTKTLLSYPRFSKNAVVLVS